jgi:MFS family permease
MTKVIQSVEARPSEFTRTSLTAAVGAWFGFLVGPNVMISSTNSNFLAVLPESLHVGPGQLTTALAFSVWIVAILVPISGRMMDRFGVRRIVIPGAILMGATFLLMSRVTQFWQYFALQLLLSIPASMHCSVGYAKIVSSWFDLRRGTVLGICVALGAGVGQTIMPKLSDYLIREYGWRGGYLGMSAIVLLIGLPAIVFLARTGTPRAPAVEDNSPAPALTGLSRAEALRSPTFYLVFFAIMLGSMSLLGTLQVAKPMLLERGLPNGLAVTVSSFAFAGVILGELSCGFVVDRLNTPRVVLPYFVLALVGLLIVHTAASPVILCAGGLLMGLGLGGEIGQNAYLISRYFGLKNFGAIYGLTFAASNLGIGVGVMAMGWVKQLSGSFEPMRYVFGVTMTLSVLCIALLPPFRFAARKSH